MFLKQLKEKWDGMPDKARHMPQLELELQTVWLYSANSCKKKKSQKGHCMAKQKLWT